VGVLVVLGNEFERSDWRSCANMLLYRQIPEIRKGDEIFERTLSWIVMIFRLFACWQTLDDDVQLRSVWIPWRAV